MVFAPEPNATWLTAILPAMVPNDATVMVPAPGVTVVFAPATIDTAPVRPLSEDTPPPLPPRSHDATISVPPSTATIIPL